ncbi:hypothetical protein RhiLY_12306 [Ceratobasidium sp. AG-Ba]|nr:hypothetical protein RhiLY_12306 [Ceratobasidium sp. AG-Ba]
MADAGNRLHQAPDYQQLLEDLHALQQQNLDRDQQIQQLLEQLGPNGQPGGDAEANGPGNNPRKVIQVALPRIMEDVRKASLDPNDPEAGDEALADNANPSLYWAVYRFHAPNAADMVREILFHMPPRAGKWWFKSWFKLAFLTGYRKIRSDIVFHVAKNHLLIFGIATTDFCNKELRTGMEEVAELLRTFQFRYKVGLSNDPLQVLNGAELTELEGRRNAPEFRHDISNVDSFMKHPCIMKTIRYIYSGESAIATGARSLKARHAHSEIWQANKVTPSVVALAVTAIQFVLSGDSSFEQSTANMNYLDFYFARLRLMEAVYEDHPDTFDDLMTYFNRSVLPTLYPPEGEEMPYEHGAIPPPDAGMTQLDVAFMEGL